MYDDAGISLDEAKRLVRRLKIEAILFFVGIFPVFALLLASIWLLGSLGWTGFVLGIGFFTGWIALALGSLANYYDARGKVRRLNDNERTVLPTRRKRIFNILLLWAFFAGLSVIVMLVNLH